jgi:hypothetical protein
VAAGVVAFGVGFGWATPDASSATPAPAEPVTTVAADVVPPTTIVYQDLYIPVGGAGSAGAPPASAAPASPLATQPAAPAEADDLGDEADDDHESDDDEHESDDDSAEHDGTSHDDGGSHNGGGEEDHADD